MARERKITRSKMHQTLANFIKDHAGETERVVIIAETRGEQVHVITNDLKYAEVFALLKMADAIITREFMTEEEEE